MKVVIALTFLLAVPSAFAETYVEYKNELKYKDTNFRKDIHHFRVGYQTKKNFYFEAGPRSNGTAAEVGYKLKKGPLTIKGKWEGSKTKDLDNKLETEVRYTWN